MPTAETLTLSLIQIGCDRAEQGVGWIKVEEIEAVRSSMNSDIGSVESTLMLWLTTNNVRIVDNATGQTILFPAP